MSGDAVLADPVGHSLRGPQRHLARTHGRAASYAPSVATFVSVPLDPAPADWSDLAKLLGPGGFVDMFSSPATPPVGWAPVFEMAGLQLVGGRPLPGDIGGEADIVELGTAAVPDMLTLTSATRPGPFLPRTHEMGTYLGIRDGGRLVAMAGERLRPPGWTEISAVCTAPEARGRGLAVQLVQELARRIAARGERPFLHVSTDNTPAIELYERLGFTVRREVVFRGFRVPS